MLQVQWGSLTGTSGNQKRFSYSKGTNPKTAGTGWNDLHGDPETFQPIGIGCMYGLDEDTLNNPHSHNADGLLEKQCCPP